MEELGIKYELKAYKKRKDMVAPPELKEIWGMGALPIVQIYPAAGQGEGQPVVLAESGFIFQYLAKHHDAQGKFKYDSAADERLADYYFHFAEGSLQSHLIALLVGDIAARQAPWGAGFLVRSILNVINNHYYRRCAVNGLKFLEGQLAAKSGAFFVGDKLSAVDILLDYPVSDYLFERGMGQRLGLSNDPAAEFPNLYQWHLHLREFPNRDKAKQVDADHVALTEVREL